MTLAYHHTLSRSRTLRTVPHSLPRSHIISYATTQCTTHYPLHIVPYAIFALYLRTIPHSTHSTALSPFHMHDPHTPYHAVPHTLLLCTLTICSLTYTKTNSHTTQSHTHTDTLMRKPTHTHPHTHLDLVSSVSRSVQGVLRCGGSYILSIRILCEDL
jgi:hypothetical protein